MTAIDWIAVAAALWAGAYGFWRGLVLTAGQWLGMLAGLLCAAALASYLLGDGDGATATQYFVVLGVAIAVTIIGAQVGSMAVEPVGRAVRSLPATRAFDSLAGGVLASLLGLAMVSFVVLIAAGLAGPSAVTKVEESRLVGRVLDDVPFASELAADISGRLERLPLFPPSTSPLPPDPNSAATAEVRAAAAAVLRVVGRGCGGIVSGSGFPVAQGLVVTNAHVVAGTRDTRVAGPNQRELRATVVLFDPEKDLAVLQVQGLTTAPLALATASRGTVGAAIGYPGGGRERIEPAVVNEHRTMTLTDIFGQGDVHRSVYAYSGVTLPGDSGGALVNDRGEAIGVIFGASTGNSGQGFAVTADELRADLALLDAGTPPMDARRTTCPT